MTGHKNPTKEEHPTQYTPFSVFYKL